MTAAHEQDLAGVIHHGRSVVPQTERAGWARGPGAGPVGVEEETFSLRAGHEDAPLLRLDMETREQGQSVVEVGQGLPTGAAPDLRRRVDDVAVRRRLQRTGGERSR